jgi:hypothetical protein
MEDIKIKRSKGSDKCKATYEKYGKFTHKAVRTKEERKEKSKLKRL